MAANGEIPSWAHAYVKRDVCKYCREDRSDKVIKLIPVALMALGLAWYLLS